MSEHVQKLHGLETLSISPVAGDGCGITCAYCGLCREQAAGTEDGETNDNGWFCCQCINKGYKRTVAQDDWAFFARDYPKFASELKRLREIVMSYGGKN